MKYLIDHLTKTIHLREYAGDRCGFADTPIEKREFTDSESYIESLVQQKGYRKCPYCPSIQIAID